jgi:hypothetical protein
MSILFAWIGLAGCGPSAGENALRSPEVRQRLLENQERREAELERRRKEYEEIQTSTEAALRAAEKLRQETEIAKGNTAVIPPPEAAKTDAAKTDAPKSAPPAQTPAVDKAPSVQPPASGDEKVPTPTTSAKGAAAWAQLRAGMSTTAVTSLLGPPTSTSEDRTLVYWHYGAGPGGGRIAFLGGSGQLVAWEPPAR